MRVSVIGIDLAKSSFAVCLMNQSGKVLQRLTLTRSKLREFLTHQPRTLVAMEACGGSHHWMRYVKSIGHDAKLMDARRVKPFSPPQKKNDNSDAEAIALAALSESTPSVRSKSTAQHDLEILQNSRSLLVRQRVQMMNQLHAIGLEYGVSLPKGKTPKAMEKIISALEDGTNELTSVARELIQDILRQAQYLDDQAEAVQRRLMSIGKNYASIELLQTIPGVGPMTATAIIAHTGGDISTFKNGRQFSAYLGLVPRQHSTGGKPKLSRITRCGHQDIRQLLVLGASANLQFANKRSDQRSKWAVKKRDSIGFGKARVAVANKTARIIFAVLKTQTPYVQAS